MATGVVQQNSATRDGQARERVSNGELPKAQIETAAAARNMKKVSTEARAKPPLGQSCRWLALCATRFSR